MRITFNCNTTETLGYLRMVNTVLEHNQNVEENVEAYRALKELVLSLNNRLNKLEASSRRNKVCR